MSVVVGDFFQTRKAEMTSKCAGVTLSLSKGVRWVTVICALNPLYGSTELTMTLLWVNNPNGLPLNIFYVIGSGGFFSNTESGNDIEVRRRHPELVEGRTMGNGDLCSEPALWFDGAHHDAALGA